VLVNKKLQCSCNLWHFIQTGLFNFKPIKGCIVTYPSTEILQYTTCKQIPIQYTSNMIVNLLLIDWFIYSFIPLVCAECMIPCCSVELIPFLSVIYRVCQSNLTFFEWLVYEGRASRCHGMGSIGIVRFCSFSCHGAVEPSTSSVHRGDVF
jgi:hypothetical protein